MARAGRMSLDIQFNDVLKNLEASISRVQRGTKKATIAACEEIKTLSLAQVPRSTNNLADAFDYQIHGSYANFTAELGYGITKDPVNSRTGQRASQYMVKEHEDLTLHHEQGKAKFLEDPIKEYQSKLLGKAAQEIQAELGN